MIPWIAFRPNDPTPDWRADLNEHNLHYYIPNGPSQLNRGVDSPMLELAHERQFAIAQLGYRSTGFEGEHVARVEATLELLHTRFTTHDMKQQCRPSSPHAEDLMDFRLSYQCFTPLPAFDLANESTPSPPAPLPVVVVAKPKRSHLGLKELMNPEPLPSSTLKRKVARDSLQAFLADSELDQVDSIDDVVDEATNHMEYARASHVGGKSANTRTHRNVRMRKMRLEETHNKEQLEKDGQLLLSLSQG